MSQVRFAIVVSLLGRYAGLLISLTSVVIISRLLSPDEIGLFSVSVTFTLLAGVLREFGVGDYLIQKKEIRQHDLRASFTISAITSWVLALAIILSRNPVAEFYNSPEMVSVLSLLSLNFVVTPFGVVANALLRRDMKFGAVSAIEAASAAVGAATAIILAYMGASFMALAWGAVVRSLFRVILVAAIRPTEIFYMPTIKNLGEVFRFGSMSAGWVIIAQIGIYAPDLILGRVLSMSAVAYFSRAQTIVRLFQTGVQQALYPVAQSYLADSARHSRQAAKIDYLKTVSLITGIAWPFFGSVMIITGNIIDIIFGDQWTASIPAAKILCIGAIIYSPVSFSPGFFLALGEIKKNLVRDIILQPLRVALILAAATINLEAVAWAIVITHTVAVVIVHAQLKSSIGLTPQEHLLSLKGSFLVSIIPIALCGALTFGFTFIAAPKLLELLVTGFIVAIFWLLSFRKIEHPLGKEIKGLVKYLPKFRTRSSKS